MHMLPSTANLTNQLGAMLGEMSDADALTELRDVLFGIQAIARPKVYRETFKAAYHDVPSLPVDGFVSETAALIAGLATAQAKGTSDGERTRREAEELAALTA
jgi:hypothetical protein